MTERGPWRIVAAAAPAVKLVLARRFPPPVHRDSQPPRTVVAGRRARLRRALAISPPKETE